MNSVSSLTQNSYRMFESKLAEDQKYLKKASQELD